MEKLIKENEENLKSDKAELENLENFLKELLSPIKTTNLPDWIKNNERIEGVERMVSDKVMSIFDKTLGKTLKWQKMTALSIYSFLLLSIVTCFMRTDFLNVRIR